MLLGHSRKVHLGLPDVRGETGAGVTGVDELVQRDIRHGAGKVRRAGSDEESAVASRRRDPLLYACQL